MVHSVVGEPKREVGPLRVCISQGLATQLISKFRCCSSLSMFSCRKNGGEGVITKVVLKSVFCNPLSLCCTLVLQFQCLQPLPG